MWIWCWMGFSQLVLLVGCFVVDLFFSFKYNLMKEEIDQCSLKTVAPYARIFKQGYL